MQVEHILLRLLAVKERETATSLVRHVEKWMDEEVDGGPKKVELQDSDGDIWREQTGEQEGWSARPVLLEQDAGPAGRGDPRHTGDYDSSGLWIDWIEWYQYSA